MDAPLVFAERDVGLGTAYERLAIYRLFDAWSAARDIRTAYEGPIDGMAGVAGLHLVGLARHGTHVTVELTDARALEHVEGIYRHLGLHSRLTTRLAGAATAPSEGTYDLALTYNALPMLDDFEGQLARVAAVAARFLLVSVTSPFSYGVSIRKAVRKVERARKQELFDHPSTRPEVIEPILRGYGTIVEHEFLDCPWWPDLFVETGETLLSGTWSRLTGRRPERPRTSTPPRGAGFLHGADSWPLFPDRPGYDALERAMRRHPVFDGRSAAVARVFAHHHAYLVAR